MTPQQLSLRLQDVTRKGGRFSSPYKPSNPLSPEEFAAAQGPSVYDQASARSLLPVPGEGEHGPLAGDHEALVEYLRRAAAEASAGVPRVAVSPGQLELDLSGASQRKQPVAAGTGGPRRRMAGEGVDVAEVAASRSAGQQQMQEVLEQVRQVYDRMPEFVREDLLEGLLVGGLGIGLPVALMPNQDANERAAAFLGGVTAATLGGAASRHIGARLGGRLHKDAYEPGSFQYNLGRVMGREDVLMDTMQDLIGTAPAPQITGKEFGRAIGRAVGDEVFGVGGTLAALAAAQAMDTTPDDPKQPTIGEVAWGTVPGAAIGLLASGLTGGMIDTVGMNRAMIEQPDGLPDFGQFVAVGRKGRK